MAEVGSCKQLADHRGAGLQEEEAAVPAYCREGLRIGGTEFCFEERRAQKYFQQKQQKMDERMKQMQEVEQQLLQELEEKTRLLEQRRSQQTRGSAPQTRGSAPQPRDSGRPPAPPTAASFQIFDESQSQPTAAAAARPSGKSGEDEVFLQPDETGPIIQRHHPGDVVSSARAQMEPRPPHRKELSPIQEASALGAMPAGNCSPLEEEHPPTPAGGAVDPCDPDVRRRLLDLCDVTSCPDLHSEPRPLPTVEEHSCLQLGGGEVFHVFSRIVDGGSFSVFKGAMKDDDVIIKVDSCCVLWDFHMFQRLKQSSSSVAGLPVISCFLFEDGCVTVYSSPAEHMLAELTECVPSEVGYKTVGLLQLVSELHSCRLLHAALQPQLLICCHRGLPSPDRVFPVDWSSSVDLDLQQITAVRQLPSAQTYISLGVLEPDAPPQLVDLVGVAETVHLLLTNSKMIPVKDDDGWTVEQFSGDQPCDDTSRMWRRFFRSLLNAGGRSSLSVLSELTELLSTLHH